MITLTKEVKPGLPVAGKGVQGAEKEGRNTPHHVLLLQGLKAHWKAGPSLSSGGSGEEGGARSHAEKDTLDHAENSELYSSSGVETRKGITRYLQDK